MSTFKVHWYPGHMEKAKRALGGIIKNADFVIEVADARAPASTRNPDLAQFAQHRPRLLVLAKADLADPGATGLWSKRLASEGERVLALSLLDAGAPRVILDRVKRLASASSRDPARHLRSIPGLALPKVGRTRVRGLVVGVPNTGKSTVIRALGGKAIKADRPGVTRGVQEFSVTGDITLYDSPGMMWPRALEGPAALRLAWLGCVGPAAYDAYEAGRELVRSLAREFPGRLAERFGFLFEENGADPDAILREIADRRGLLRGADPDLERAATVVLLEFRKGLLGPITLELPGQEAKG